MIWGLVAPPDPATSLKLDPDHIGSVRSYAFGMKGIGIQQGRGCFTLHIRRRATAFAFLALAILAPILHTHAGDTILDRHLQLTLWNESLDETARTIKTQTDVDILFYLPDLPPDFTSQKNVHLVTGQVPLATVLECLARTMGFRYRVSDAGHVELSRGYGWAKSEPALDFIRTPPLLPDDQTGTAMRRLLEEFTKPLSMIDGEYSLDFEPYPLPGSPAHLRGTAALPPVLADYLARAVKCLLGDPGDYPTRQTPDRPLFAQARPHDPGWEKALLSRRVNTPRERTDIQAILADIANQTNLAIALKEPPDPNGSPLPDDVRWYTLGRIADALSARWNLGKRVFLSCGAVVFERGMEQGYEADFRSRELFWDGLAVAGFDAATGEERAGSEGVAARLRREVQPGLWRDPVCSLVYIPGIGRLVVIAPRNVVEAVGRRLERLQQ